MQEVLTKRNKVFGLINPYLIEDVMEKSRLLDWINTFGGNSECDGCVAEEMRLMGLGKDISVINIYGVGLEQEMLADIWVSFNLFSVSKLNLRQSRCIQEMDTSLSAEERCIYLV